jgi:pyrimidine-nucleoside phosphorylase
MDDIGRRAGKKMLALITNMDRPLGYAIGNTLEVKEAIDVLCGRGPRDLTDICIALATDMLALTGEHGDRAECERKVREAITSGKALDTLARMVKAQGGDDSVIYHPDTFAKATHEYTVKAPRDGYIVAVDTEGYGVASLLLGAGRNTMEDEIDYTAGIILRAKTGDYVRAGDPIATLCTCDDSRFAAAEQRLLAATVIGDEKPEDRPLIFARVE